MTAGSSRWARRRSVEPSPPVGPTSPSPSPDEPSEAVDGGSGKVGGDPEPWAEARLICARLLAHRARSRFELAERLAAKDIPADIAADVLDRFTELGWVDDHQFATAFAGSQRRQRGASAQEIKRQLRARGIDEDTAAQTAASFDSESDEATARSLVQRKLPSLAAVDDLTRVRRLTGLLARRGYSAGLTSAVISAELGRDPARQEATDRR